MSAIPRWVIGKTVTSFSLTPQNVAADGTLSNGTAQSLVGIWDEIDLEYETETEEISAADALRQNTVVLKDTWRLRFSQILVNKSGTPNPLAALFGNADVFLLTLVRGQNTWSVYMARTGYTEQIRKGKSMGVFTAAVIDAGPPVYTGP